jgi:hypothetical protein
MRPAATTFVAAVVKLALLAALVASCGAGPSDAAHAEPREASSSRLHHGM